MSNTDPTKNPGWTHVLAWGVSSSCFIPTMLLIYTVR